MSDIIFGSHAFTSPDLIPKGLDSGKDRFTSQQFLSGGFRTYASVIKGQPFTLSATLDSTGTEDKLMGVIRWADILALRAMPNTHQSFSHSRLVALGETDVTAKFDKTSLDNLTFYDPNGMGEPINPAVDSVYPRTDLLLCWYGVLNFIRTN
ncbi:MAG: hypothetical protein JRC99_00040 [Deltaproteobacteria bacterium]|nr:hypothetical protein [Deltaproteobacteria bacterium]